MYELLLRDAPVYAGAFLEIGSGHPVIINNTYVLETIFDWSGILLDYNHQTYQECLKYRPRSVCLHADATTCSWRQILTSHAVSNVMDYLSFDVDEAAEKSFENFPFDEYRFKLITMEHDCYRFGDRVKEKMRARLQSLAYHLLCADVRNDGNPFEDWWIDPVFVAESRFSRFQCSGKEWSEIVT